MRSGTRRALSDRRVEESGPPDAAPLVLAPPRSLSVLVPVPLVLPCAAGLCACPPAPSWAAAGRASRGGRSSLCGDAAARRKAECATGSEGASPISDPGAAPPRLSSSCSAFKNATTNSCASCCWYDRNSGRNLHTAFLNPHGDMAAHFPFHSRRSRRWNCTQRLRSAGTVSTTSCALEARACFLCFSCRDACPVTVGVAPRLCDYP